VEDTFRDRGGDVDYENAFSDDDNDADVLQKVDEDREDAARGARDTDGIGMAEEESDNEYQDDSGGDSDTGDKDAGGQPSLA
jgi:hypothetical protein